MIGKKYFGETMFLILKFLFDELEQFLSSLSSEILFFQGRVWQNNRVFSSSKIGKLFTENRKEYFPSSRRKLGKDTFRIVLLY